MADANANPVWSIGDNAPTPADAGLPFQHTPADADLVLQQGFVALPNNDPFLRFTVDDVDPDVFNYRWCYEYDHAGNVVDEWLEPTLVFVTYNVTDARPVVHAIVWVPHWSVSVLVRRATFRAKAELRRQAAHVSDPLHEPVPEELLEVDRVIDRCVAEGRVTIRLADGTIVGSFVSG